MKNARRNLTILALVLGGVCYGTFLVVGSTAVPVLQEESGAVPGEYLIALQERLYELVEKEAFAEAEIVFSRVRKLNPDNRNILRLGSVIRFRNGKLNEAENLSRNLLLSNPGDYVCRNNYGVVLMAKGRKEAVRELEKAWLDSGKKAYIRNNLQLCAAAFNMELDLPLSKEEGSFSEAVPLDAITLPKEKK